MSNLIISGDLTSVRVLGKSAEPITLIQPATTFTAATPTDGGGGTIVLTSAGAHGLTAAVAIGKSIYISGGTGWTAGLYLVTALDLDTTGVAITVSGTFDGGMGSPTIALANTEVTMAAIGIPPLSANSMFEYKASWGYSNSSSTKTLRSRLSGNQIQSTSPTTTAGYATRKIIANRGATNSQIIATALADGSLGATTSAYGTLSVDTSVVTWLTFTAQPAVNNVVTLESYVVTLL